MIISFIGSPAEGVLPLLVIVKPFSICMSIPDCNFNILRLKPYSRQNIILQLQCINSVFELG